ncbi:MAG: hypothetical protein OFPII_09990 [Osedax symbiont Rs1]|nr:MAG: hypothetical protein OFPII_09990 [Osedax symbiont Rs1]
MLCHTAAKPSIKTEVLLFWANITDDFSLVLDDKKGFNGA